MHIAKGIAILGLAAMSWALWNGFTVGDFSTDGQAILQNPWGIVSLIDLYTGFILFSGWIVFREKSWVQAGIWVISMMVLGFFTGSLYALLALYGSDGDWKKFWMGHRADD